MIPDALITEIVRAFPAVAVLVYVAWRQERLIQLIVTACMDHLAQEAADDEATNTERLGR